MKMFLYFQSRKVINIAYSNSLHAKKIPPKNSSFTNLFATRARINYCLRHIVASMPCQRKPTTFPGEFVLKFLDFIPKTR